MDWRLPLVFGALGAPLLIAGACSLSGLADGTPDASSSAGAAGLSGSGGAGGSPCEGGAGCGSGGTGAGESCSDQIKNGTETDVDCGGTCPGCTLDRACSTPSDCRSNGCEAGQCTCPSGMVRVPTPIAEAVDYCVDATEVTNEQYGAYLDTNPDPKQQPELCAWNTSFEPSTFQNALSNKPQHPVVNVDWCDARAYCVAMGKRLCGKLGGGSHVYSLPQSATNEWYVACSAAGKKTYVYGSPYDPMACAGEDYFDGGNPTTVPVGSLSGCEGGYPGIVDMSGNVWEWEDSCNDVDGGDAAVTACRRRGGAFDDSEFCLRCSACGGASRARNAPTGATGFRCCSG